MSIYRIDRRLKNEYERIKQLRKEDAEVLTRYDTFHRSKGTSKFRRFKILWTLRKFSGWLGKQLQDATKDDIIRVLSDVSDMQYSAWTKRDYRAVVKTFYDWLEKKDLVDWIQTTLSRREMILPEQLFTWEDVKKMVAAAKNLRDKALVMTLYESGCRIGEIGGMDIKDVSFKENYSVIRVKGKTGSRPVILVHSTPYLMNWIENHPVGKGALWVSIGTKSHLNRLSYPGISHQLKYLARKAKIKKRIHPHKFRHSRATELAKDLTEAQLSQMFGWSQGSRMPRVYVHLSGRDIKTALLKLYGIEEGEEGEREHIIKKCPRCGTVNQFESKFCNKCGLILDIKEAFKQEERKELVKEKVREALDILDILEEDPELKKRVLAKLQPRP